MSVDDLYQELLLDHFKHPRCQEAIAAPSATHEAYNPLCGDRISAALLIRDGTVSAVSFRGQGCCISQSAMSLLSELITGKTAAEAGEILAAYRSLMAGERSGSELPQLGDVRALEGVRRYSARLKCALLGCGALQRCLDECS